MPANDFDTTNFELVYPTRELPPVPGLRSYAQAYMEPGAYQRLKQAVGDDWKEATALTISGEGFRTETSAKSLAQAFEGIYDAIGTRAEGSVVTATIELTHGHVPGPTIELEAKRKSNRLYCKYAGIPQPASMR